MQPVIFRIDPTLPLGWENVDTLRFGFDRAEARVHDPSAGAQRFIARLLAGVRSDRLAAEARRAGLGRAERQQLLDALAPVLIYESPESSSAARATKAPVVSVIGTGPLADALRGELAAAGFGEPHESMLPAFALLVERFMSPAERAHQLLLDGVPHLPVRVTDRSLCLGPLVPADGSPCLSCVELREADENPTAAVLAAQLGMCQPGAETEQCCRVAASVATRAVEQWAGGSNELVGARWRFPVIFGVPAPVPVVSRIDPHPSCGCAMRAMARAA